ncbi:MAG: response regulator [Planctomycetes bacterium]|nr:response regulator [Planctomycetota bacterium]
MHNTKEVLTTGQVARICNVAPRTVSKWFDNGQLRGYRIPGSKDRRIPLSHLVRFMRAHNIPLDGLETGQTQVLLLDSHRELTELITESLEADGGYQVTTATTAFEAGVAAGISAPHVMVVDVSLPDSVAADLVRAIRSQEHLQTVRLIATSGGITDGQGQALLQDGFHAYLRKPFEIRQLVQAIEDALAIVH